MKLDDSQELIKYLNLSPHPEGGFYRETYRSPLEISEIKGFEHSRCSSTGIYFLLTSGSRSHLHRIKSDEMWHFYQGDPLRLVMLWPDGGVSYQMLGPHISKGETFQFVVPAGCWFGAEVGAGGGYSLVGCTVAPGFDFADFELARRDSLMDQYPGHEALIDRFCLSDS